MAEVHERSALAQYREEVDSIDEQIVELLNQRRERVLAIGAIKQAQRVGVHDYTRENEVLSHIRDINGGPMSDEEIMLLYARLLEMNRRVQYGVSPVDNNNRQLPITTVRRRGW